MAAGPARPECRGRGVDSVPGHREPAPVAKLLGPGARPGKPAGVRLFDRLLDLAAAAGNLILIDSWLSSRFSRYSCRSEEEPTTEAAAERLRKARQRVMANRSDRVPPSLHVTHGREIHGGNKARIGRSQQVQRAIDPASIGRIQTRGNMSFQHAAAIAAVFLLTACGGGMSSMPHDPVLPPVVTPDPTPTPEPPPEPDPGPTPDPTPTPEPPPEPDPGPTPDPTPTPEPPPEPDPGPTPDPTPTPEPPPEPDPGPTPEPEPEPSVPEYGTWGEWLSVNRSFIQTLAECEVSCQSRLHDLPGLSLSVEHPFSTTYVSPFGEGVAYSPDTAWAATWQGSVSGWRNVDPDGDGPDTRAWSGDSYLRIESSALDKVRFWVDAYHHRTDGTLSVFSPDHVPYDRDGAWVATLSTQQDLKGLFVLRHPVAPARVENRDWAVLIGQFDPSLNADGTPTTVNGVFSHRGHAGWFDADLVEE